LPDINFAHIFISFIVLLFSILVTSTVHGHGIAPETNLVLVTIATPRVKTREAKSTSESKLMKFAYVWCGA